MGGSCWDDVLNGIEEGAFLAMPDIMDWRGSGDPSTQDLGGGQCLLPGCSSFDPQWGSHQWDLLSWGGQLGSVYSCP